METADPSVGQTADEGGRLLSGTEIARFLGVHQSTWGRWSRRGKAPAPVHETENLKLYDHAEVIVFLDRLAELDGSGRWAA